MIKGITANEEVIIKQLLAPYTPEYAFYFYGSRVKGGYTKVSDLDILIRVTRLCL
jgi:predicted nucleotidyltransferase